MIFMKISSFVLFILCFCESKHNGIQALGGYSSQIPTTASRKGVINTNIESLLTSASKSGVQPTIVAIPLYIRNTLSSKYPSVFEIMSTLQMQNRDKSKKVSDIQSNESESSHQIKKPLIETQKHNEFKPIINSQSLKLSSQKATKYVSREEQKAFKPQRDEHKYDSEVNGFTEHSNRPKGQSLSSVSMNTNSNQFQNQFLQSSDRITFLRSTVPQRHTSDDQRKQNLIDFDSLLARIGLNKFNEGFDSTDEQKSNKYSDNGSVDGISGYNYETMVGQSGPTNTMKNYNSFDDKSYSFNREIENPSISSLQTQSENSEDFESNNSEDNNNQYSNKYQNYNNGYETNDRKNEFQYHSPVSYSRPTERSTYSSAYPVSANSYTSRPVVYKNNYDNSYVTPKPYQSSSLSPMYSNEESSHSMHTNFQPMTAPESEYRSSSGGYNDNFGTYSQNSQNNPNFNSQSISSNTYNSNTESKSHLNSDSNPNYSKDYSEEDCIDNTSNDYKTPYLSQSSKSQTNTKSDLYDMSSKGNERDSNYDFEDLDPSKLDLKIVHLPVSLLRRLVGNGNIGLPGFQ